MEYSEIEGTPMRLIRLILSAPFILIAGLNLGLAFLFMGRLLRTKFCTDLRDWLNEGNLL